MCYCGRVDTHALNVWIYLSELLGDLKLSVFWHRLDVLKEHSQRWIFVASLVDERLENSLCLVESGGLSCVQTLPVLIHLREFPARKSTC